MNTYSLALGVFLIVLVAAAAWIVYREERKKRAREKHRDTLRALVAAMEAERNAVVEDIASQYAAAIKSKGGEA